jgi:hypothetical protein
MCEDRAALRWALGDACSGRGRSTAKAENGAAWLVAVYRSNPEYDPRREQGSGERCAIVEGLAERDAESAILPPHPLGKRRAHYQDLVGSFLVTVSISIG